MSLLLYIYTPVIWSADHISGVYIYRERDGLDKITKHDAVHAYIYIFIYIMRDLMHAFVKIGTWNILKYDRFFFISEIVKHDGTIVRPCECFVLVRQVVTIGIKHGFSCIIVCQVPREVLKTEAEGRGFQHLPRDLANVNVLENNV